MHAHKPFYFSFHKMRKLSINTKRVCFKFFLKNKRLLVKQRGKFDIHLTKQEEFDIVYDVIWYMVWDFITFRF